jgi:demethoxyubiquinone hydroxylase (CLK1/Coq7/Cat5 family)
VTDDLAQRVTEAIGQELMRQHVKASLDHLADATAHTFELVHAHIRQLERRIERMEMRLDEIEHPAEANQG